MHSRLVEPMRSMWQAPDTVHRVDKQQNLSASLSSSFWSTLQIYHSRSAPFQAEPLHDTEAVLLAPSSWSEDIARVCFLSTLFLRIQLSRNVLPARDSGIAGSHTKLKTQMEGNRESKNSSCLQGFRRATLPTGQWGLGAVPLNYKTHRRSTGFLPVKIPFWWEFSWRNLLGSWSAFSPKATITAAWYVMSV